MHKTQREKLQHTIDELERENDLDIAKLEILDDLEKRLSP